MDKTLTCPPIIDLRLLHYFLALANHGSISAAASALGLAQPSVSENITKLEKRLNIQLAIRGPRGITLTEAGLALARQGKELIDAAERLAQEVSAIAGDVRGHVAVGLPPSLSILLSVPLAETVYTELSSVRLHVVGGLSGDILEWVASGRLDLGCVYENPDSAVFESHPILIEELFIVSAPDNLPRICSETGSRSVSAEALSGLPLVMPSAPHGARRFLERFARANRINLNVAIEMDSLPQIIEMVSRASAYTVLPHAAVARAVEAGELALIKINNSRLQRTAYLTRKRSGTASAASLAVRRTMLKIIREMIERFKLEASLTPYALAELGETASANKAPGLEEKRAETRASRRPQREAAPDRTRKAKIASPS